jgi:hypothetical protein
MTGVLRASKDMCEVPRGARDVGDQRKGDMLQNDTNIIYIYCVKRTMQYRVNEDVCIDYQSNEVVARVLHCTGAVLPLLHR